MINIKNLKLKVINYNYGFTLIELLIVMAIIALLAGISVVALGGARASARDAKRKSDLESIRAALEIYRADCNQYPSSLPSPLQSPASCPAGANTYMQVVPKDPSGNPYYYSATGNTYRLCACLEEQPNPAMTCTGSGCGAGTYPYRLGNP